MSSSFDEIHAAASLMNMRSHGRRQQLQLPPLVLPPSSYQGYQSSDSPFPTIHSSSTVTTSYTFEQYTSHCASPSSPSAVRLPLITPPPMPMPEDGSFVLSPHRSRAISQSPSQSSYFGACQQGYPNGSYFPTSQGYSPSQYTHGRYSSGQYNSRQDSHRQQSHGQYQASASPSNAPTVSSAGLLDNYSSCYNDRDNSPTLAIKTQHDAEEDQPLVLLPFKNSRRSTIKPLSIERPPTIIPKNRSSIQPTNKISINKSSNKKKAQSLRKKKTSSTVQQRLTQWVNNLCTFLDSNLEQLNLSSAKEGTIYTTLPSQKTICKTIKPAKPTNNRSRTNAKGQISTHRFAIPIDVTALKTHDYLALFDASTNNDADIDETIAAHQCCNISCVRWEGQLWITNSDICHIVKFRVEATGFQVTDREKLFEGVYSDLRIVTKKDVRYEEAKGAFLNALDEYGCISMHKRQKLYKWSSVPHLQLYISALRRCIQGGKACKPIRQPALQLCSGEISIESLL